MELINIQGCVPGEITATLSHQCRVRQVPMTVAVHPAGGWRILHGSGEPGPRCHAVTTAVLLEASEAFAELEMQPA